MANRSTRRRRTPVWADWHTGDLLDLRLCDLGLDIAGTWLEEPIELYEGMTVTGVPAVTVRQGEVAWRDGKITVDEGTGRYIERPCFAPYYGAIKQRSEVTAPTAVKR